MQQVLDRYTVAALAGDRASAAEVATGLLSRDIAPEKIIGHLLAPSQVDVGNRWLEQTCSVGAEHTATFVTESILASLAVGLEPPVTEGRMIMVCAEGEWHGLPARMAAELLMLQGWRVTFLGPATPANHLRAYLADAEADVVGVSCSIASNLPGAARTVRVARRLGFTTIVGGAAFGTSATRARAIGADGWASSVNPRFDLDSVVWRNARELDHDAEWAMIEHERLELTRQAMRWLSDHHPQILATGGSWLEHVVGDLDEIIRHASAALLCDDRSILVEHRQWLGRLMVASGLRDAAATVGFDAVASVLRHVSPNASAMVSRAAAEVPLDRRP
jgi:methanogenic corrinoid protein MtbC1